MSFGEVDYSVSERENSVDVSVSRSGFLSASGSLTYTITPLSLEQAATLYGYLPSGEEDSAEPGKVTEPATGCQNTALSCLCRVCVCGYSTLTPYSNGCTIAFLDYAPPNRPGLVGTP